MKKILSILAVAGLIALLAFGMRMCKQVSYGALESNDAFVVMQLQVVADEINVRLPAQVNETLRLDETQGGPGKTFTSFYTLTAAPSGGVDDSARQVLIDDARKTACTAQDLKPLFDAGIEIVHHYRDAAGAEVFTLVLTGDSCGETSAVSN